MKGRVVREEQLRWRAQLRCRPVGKAANALGLYDMLGNIWDVVR